MRIRLAAVINKTRGKKMKKALMLVAVCAIAAFMTGCMSTHTNDAAASAKACVGKKFEADIQAGKTKVSGSATIHNVLGLISWGVSSYADDAFVTTNTSALPFLAVSPLDVAKQGATYNACTANKADMLLAAKYNIKISDYLVYKKIECQVAGFPGVVKGVK